MPPAALRLELACDLVEVRGTALAVCGFLTGQGCSEREVKDCELALTEACNNAILYTAPESRPKPVIVEALCDRRCIELRVTDHTAGFDLPSPEILPDPGREHGRGIYLIRSVMDEVLYRRSAGENVMVMRKRRVS